MADRSIMTSGVAPVRAVLLSAMLLLGMASRAAAEISGIVVGGAYGPGFLPLMVMEQHHLVEKHVEAAGLPAPEMKWLTVAGPSVINDGLITGAIQFAVTGSPSLITLWAKTRGDSAVRGVAAMTSYPLYLNVRNPKIRSIADFSETDKIVVPSVKVSTPAIALQMAAAQAFGAAEYARLDPLTVSLSHPDGMLALINGTAGVDAHFASSPYHEQEMRTSGVRTLFSSYDAAGGQTSALVVTAATRFRDANPRTFGAFLAALDEAVAWINADKASAARLYLEASHEKTPEAEILQIISSPGYVYTLTPQRVFRTASFMYESARSSRGLIAGKTSSFPKSTGALAIDRLLNGEARVTKISAALAAMMLVVTIGPAHAELSEIVVAKQYGLSFLPLLLMERDHSVEKQVAADGSPAPKMNWQTLAGPSAINDGLIAGSVHFAIVGPPSIVTFWAKTQGANAIRGVSSVTAYPMYLNVRNPKVQSVRDFTEADKIVVPSVKVSWVAVVLQMAAAKAFGDAGFDKLDPFTVGLSHPDGLLAMSSGTAAVDAHFTASPYYEKELAIPGVRTIADSNEIMGGPSSAILLVASARFREANPKTYRAFLTSLRTTMDTINRDKHQAALDYIEISHDKSNGADEIVKMMSAPGYAFSMTPQKVYQTALFMQRIGSVKQKPDSWKDLFFPEVYELPGD